MPDDRPAEQHPLWAHRLSRHVAAWRSRDDALTDDENGLPRQAWLLLHTAVLGYLAGIAGVPPVGCSEELLDLAAQKTLELAQRITGDRWRPDTATPSAVAAYVRTAARNCLWDHRRRRRRLVPAGDTLPEPVAPARLSPDRVLERRDYADALADCVACLEPRTRVAWLLRVLHDFPSRRIAGHPEVDTTPGNVDVLLHRGRRQVRGCMAAKGYAVRDLPATVMVTLWRRFHREAEPEAPFRQERKAHG